MLARHIESIRTLLFPSLLALALALPLGAGCSDSGGTTTGDTGEVTGETGDTPVDIGDETGDPGETADTDETGDETGVPTCKDDADCIAGLGDQLGACESVSCVENACAVGTAPDGTACDDGDACTAEDACAGGVCAGSGSACDDGDPCTDDACDPATGACESAAVACDDGDACTVDTCDSSAEGCVYEAVACDDGDPCTAGACDAATGECVYAGVDGVDDGDPCTTDGCDPATGEVVHTPVGCDDGDACTTDTCDPASGDCTYTPMACDDEDLCTDDACDAATGECAFTPKDCGESDACATVACDEATGECVESAVETDDADPCTADSCDPTEGVLHAPLDCADDDLCTTDACDPAGAAGGDPCTHEPTSCDDLNVCTTDSCDPNTGGCVHLQLDADDADPCTIDTCDPTEGGVNTPVDCDDSDPCTIDSCDPTTGGCVHGPTCADDDLCTIDVCDAGACSFHPVDISDDDPCTEDSCDPELGAVFEPIDCADADPCTIDSCDPATGGCLHGTPDGDDGDLCTIDSCDPDLGAINTPIDCSDEDPCTDDFCDPAGGSCTHEPADCDDGEACTEDACDLELGCVHAPIEGCDEPADACEPSDHPGSGDAALDACVCAIDTFCCEDAWDDLCVVIAEDGCDLDCGGGGDEGGDPCEPSALPGSDDAEVSACVCGFDPFCCEEAWDDLCVSTAEGLCGVDCGGVPGDGPCDPSGAPGSGDEELDACVCGLDPFCCESAWDAICVDEAQAECGLFCDDPPGDPCEPSDVPGSGDDELDACVCGADPFCCDTAWDGLCVELAEAECGLSCAASDPCEPSSLPGSGDPELDACVCSLDPFCCETAWDGVCVDEAQAECGLACGGGAGAPCEPSDGAGSGDPDLDACVCSFDPFCCETAWDAVCVEEAQTQCDLDCDAPPVSPCEATGEPTSGDADVDACVCDADPFCCESGWDDLCVEEAQALCDVDCGLGGPCEPHASPGSGLADLDACVCDELGAAFCCEGAWDQTCVAVAENGCGLTCDEAGAQSPCEESELPGANDPDAEACVCDADPFCCEQAWDELCVAEASEVCGVECGGGPPENGCCEPSDQPGCWDPDCMAAVCAMDPFCCETAWDQVCVDQAPEVCPAADCWFGASCCEVTGLPGCGGGGDGSEIESCVCALDPFCCETTWDEVCVDEAIASCGLICDGVEPPQNGCCEPSEVPGCDDPDCMAAVCEADAFCCDTAWDELCVGEAIDLCPGVDCLPAQGCCAASDVPGCDDPDVETCVCSFDTFCCETAWDDICVGGAEEACGLTCDEPPPGGDCCVPGEYLGCEDTGCTDAVCAIDPFCCDTQWDGICAGEATDLCEVCGGPPTGGCCDPHDSAGCDDPTCESLVCTDDPFCCDTQWDDVCSASALGLCEVCFVPPTSGCCEPHDGVGCDDAACEASICDADAFCCDTQWDAICADAAAETCVVCTGPPAGSCCEANTAGGAGCVDATCEAQICAEDSFCCDNSWDGICADAALALCAVCADAGDCCETNEGPGCGDAECMSTVCSADPFCCESQWDDLCASSALELCAACSVPPSAGCCLPHDGVGCDDPACESEICSADAFCCDTQWDDICAGAAVELCPVCGDPPAGDCCAPNGGVGCEDAECTSAVCGDDPFCCESEWDDLCADAAQQLCPQCDAPPAPSCCTSSEVAGCDDPECEAQTCGADPFCCETVWDPLCADAAQQLCPQCDTPPAASCCTSGEVPGCDDPECEAQTCGADPFCCETVWDQLCADAALEACAACEGEPTNHCCITSEVPGCTDPQCMAAVCEVDAFCCDTAWDALCVEWVNETPECSEICDIWPISCCADSAFPGCDDTNVALCVCSFDAFCCDNAWDSICVDEAQESCGLECGDPPAADPCVPHDAATSGDGAIDACVCDEMGAGFCCEIVWDEECVFIADELCGVECGGGPAGCTPGELPGSGDPELDACLCALDPFCCETAWDAICVGEAQEACGLDCGGGPTGDPCVPQDTPGSGDADIDACVCALDPFCCDSSWDALCVEVATSDCGVGCPGTGDPCEPHESPGSGDPEIDACACGADPFCCETAWDSVCVELAVAACGVDCAGPTLDPCVPGQAAGSGDPALDTCVCEADPFCCEEVWDDLCVGEATGLCGLDCDGPAAGCEPQDAPGSGDADLDACVCSVDPFCCEQTWDAICVDIATDACGACDQGGPADPCLPGEASTSGNPDIDACVCSADPFCCDQGWDELCVSIAQDLCGVTCDAAPGGACEPSDAPGSGDDALDACVCDQLGDFSCCESSWDQGCVFLAETFCGLSCGPTASPCVGSAEPGSGDPALDACVCAEVGDIFCCETQWDDICIEEATESCGLACE